MNTRFSKWFVLALLIVTPIGASAQVRSTLNQGDEIRITSDKLGIGELRVKFVSVRSQYLLVKIDGHSPLIALPLENISRIEVKVGKSKHLRNAFAGAVLGFAVGTLWAPNSNSETISLPGAVIGVVVGTAVGGEEWREVDLEALGYSGLQAVDIVSRSSD